MTDPEKHAAVAALIREGVHFDDIVSRLAERWPEMNVRFVYRVADALKAKGEHVPEPSPTPSLAAPEVLPPATDADRKVDEILLRSRTWKRVQGVLKAWALKWAPKHPEAVSDLAAALKGLNL